MKLKKKEQNGDDIRPKELPTFDELRIFVEAWESIEGARGEGDAIKSIRQLSLAIGMSHVSMMDNLNRIDSKYGAVLLSRDTLQLTDTGRVVFDWGKAVIDLYRKGLGLVEEERPLRLVVGIGGFPAEVLRRAIVLMALERFAVIERIAFTPIPDHEALKEVESGSVQVWVGPWSRRSSWDGPNVQLVEITEPLPVVKYQYHQSFNRDAPEVVVAAIWDPGIFVSHDIEACVWVPTGLDALELLKTAKQRLVFYGHADSLPVDDKRKSQTFNRITLKKAEGYPLAVCYRKDLSKQGKAIVEFVIAEAKRVWPSPASAPEAPPRSTP